MKIEKIKTITITLETTIEHDEILDFTDFISQAITDIEVNKNNRPVFADKILIKLGRALELLERQ